ncbi:MULTISPECIES: hypothetical protein [Streptomyces]|uniref:hypothetical protein n=1 Tax=Streptomyces TaxID=1883 RepID=UPI000B08F6A4|nr:hypothetical protein [Streptomyces sp. PAN_FS17]
MRYSSSVAELSVVAGARAVVGWTNTGKSGVRWSKRRAGTDRFGPVTVVEVHRPAAVAAAGRSDAFSNYEVFPYGPT